MSRSVRVIIICLLAAFNLYLFWPGSLYFLNDDFIHIPLSDEDKLFQTNSVRPVHELLVSLDLIIWGKQAGGFHLTALVLHAIVCLQLYGLSCDLLQRHGSEKQLQSFAGFFAVAIFLVYPQHAEAEAWILGRTPILSAIFLLPVLRWWLQGKVGGLRIFIAAILFAAALFTYEQSIFLPLVLLVFSFLEKQSSERRKNLVYTSVLILVTVVYLICRQLITSQLVGTYEGSGFLSFDLPKLAANAGRLLARLWVNPSTNNGLFLASTLFMMLMLAQGYLGWRRQITNRGLLLFCSVMVLALILPVLSLGVSTRSFESGRFLYLPSIFLSAGLGYVFAIAWNKIPARVIPAIVLFLAYWSVGKTNAGRDYRVASAYSKKTTTEVVNHFNTTSTPLRIDTLHASIRELPVFRLGFKEGLQWLSPKVDTSKVIVVHHLDEAGK